MTIALWCVLAGGLMPLIWTATAKFTGDRKLTPRDNKNPRAFLAGATGRQALPLVPGTGAAPRATGVAPGAAAVLGAGCVVAHPERKIAAVRAAAVRARAQARRPATRSMRGLLFGQGADIALDHTTELDFQLVEPDLALEHAGGLHRQGAADRQLAFEAAGDDRFFYCHLAPV